MPHKYAKYLTELEMGGILFCFLASLLMKQLYTLTDGHLIGVLFGAVNNSVWEQAKTLLLPYLLWGMLLHPPFRFFRSYFVKRGFLDGVAGLVIARSAAFSTFVKYAKLWEARLGARRRDRPPKESDT